jgi:hypothetical protein
LPFKCFNCGKVGHFSAKYPYPKEDLEDEEDKINNTRIRKNPITKKGFTKGKIIFTQKKKTTVHQNPVTVMMMKSFF